MAEFVMKPLRMTRWARAWLGMLLVILANLGASAASSKQEPPGSPLALSP